MKGATIRSLVARRGCLHVGLWGRPDTHHTVSRLNDIVLLASLQYHAKKQEQVRQLLERLMPLISPILN